MDKTRFIEAVQAFGHLERLAGQGNSTVPFPRKSQKHFATAALAVAKLYSVGKEELLRLETEGVVHHSTISGGSLPVAFQVVSSYLTGERKNFGRDEYEQVLRSCQSARTLYERNINGALFR